MGSKEIGKLVQNMIGVFDAELKTLYCNALFGCKDTGTASFTPWSQPLIMVYARNAVLA
jgi:hypothetical protein